MENSDVDMAYQDLYEVIPELRIFNMHRTYVSSITDLGYYDPSLLQRYDSMGSPRSSQYDSPVHSHNLSEWVKTSIMGDCNQLANFDYVPEQPNSPRGQTDLQSELLVYKTQKLIAQPRSFDDCTCSSYSSDAPNCTCGTVKTENFKPSLEHNLTPMKQQTYQKTPESWLNDGDFNRMQKQSLFQSIVVPDPSNQYPYYMTYDGSIYDEELNQTLPFINSPTPEMQRVPKIAEPTYNVPSPITSPGLKSKTSRPRLCHFLLELLANPAQYSDIIEWVDKEKGVFKFLNSAEVASNWGRRRNKPHMKYENFARSLRTYIAKGILTKPRSKLVYRFTSNFY